MVRDKDESKAHPESDTSLEEQFKREALDAGFDPNEWRGIFVMQGQRLGISSFTISIDDKGELSSPGPTLSTAIEMAPYWLEVAMEHAKAAQRLVSRTNEAWKTDDPSRQTVALNAEFKAAFQAMTAAAFAIDAFYATVKEVAPVPEATLKAWNKNRTRRSRRVFETIRRNFPMTVQSQASLKQFLDQLFSFRDQAVHPTPQTKEAKKHPRLPVSLDEMFCKFRARNAWVSVGVTIEMIESLVNSPKIRSSALQERLEPLKVLIDPIATGWRRSRAGKRHRQDTPSTAI
jgi:hypothetical protein